MEKEHRYWTHEKGVHELSVLRVFPIVRFLSVNRVWVDVWMCGCGWDEDDVAWLSEGGSASSNVLLLQ